MLGKIIKHNRAIQLLDLTSTGLSAAQMKEIGSSMRKAKSLLSIHLSANPGVSNEFDRQWLRDRIKCRQLEDIYRYKRIRDKIHQVLKDDPPNILDGIRSRVTREIDMRIKTDHSDPISAHEKFVMQRFLGHKEEIPGSGMWYEASSEVSHAYHNKYDCWICEGQIFSVIFWSRGLAYKMDPVLNKEQTEIVRYEIDRDFGPQDDNDHMHCNANLEYKKLQDQ